MEIKIRYILKNKTTEKIEKKIYYLNQIEKGFSRLFDFENYDILSKDFFIGKQDKNKKNIFENDICLDEYSNKGYIIFLPQAFGFVFVYKDYNGKPAERKIEYIRELQIIGNRHENTELLK